MMNTIRSICIILFLITLSVPVSAESKTTSRDFAEYSVSQAYQSGYDDGYWIGYNEGFDVGSDSSESSFNDGYLEAENKYTELLEKEQRSAAYRGAFAVSIFSAFIIFSIIDHYKRKVSKLQYELDMAKESL